MLTYFYRGYQPTLQELYNEPQKLESRYREVSERLPESSNETTKRMLEMLEKTTMQ